MAGYGMEGYSTEGYGKRKQNIIYNMFYFQIWVVINQKINVYIK